MFFETKYGKISVLHNQDFYVLGMFFETKYGKIGVYGWNYDVC